jgi:hypothetical protein
VPGAPPSLSRPLLLLTAAALLVRVAFVFLEPATRPVADEGAWTGAAGVLSAPGVAFSPVRYRGIFHPPVYAYFVGAISALFGGLMAVKLAQAVVSAMLVPALGRLGAAAFGPETGLLAAAVAAFYPELVWFSAHFWAETVFMVLLWWAFERLVAADASASPALAAAAGLLFGLAVLTRETVLYFAPLAALWLAHGRRSGRARAALFLAVVVLAVAPWTYRNWVVHGAFVPVSTAGGLNLYQGNARLSRPEVYERYWAVRGLVEKYRFARRAGLEAIWERQPTWLLEKLRDEMPNFWEADSQALVHIRRGAYGEVGPASAVAAALVVLFPFLAALALFAVGLAYVPLRRSTVLLLGFLAYYNLLHVVTHGYARYRLPALPVVLMVAAAGAVALRSRTAPEPSRRRLAVAFTVAAALVLSLVPSLRLQARQPAFGLVESDERPEDGAVP